MAKGLASPPRALRGKTVLESGASQLRKIVRMSVRPGDSANPFLVVGVPSVVFTLADETLKGQFEARVRANFARLERDKRAKFRKMTMEPNKNNGDVSFQVEYVDLEVQRPEAVVVSKGA